jgi:hypothetical protein
MRLCPRGAQRDREFSSIDEEAREGRGSPEIRGLVDGSGKMVSLCMDGLVVEVFWKERGWLRRGRGFL